MADLTTSLACTGIAGLVGAFDVLLLWKPRGWTRAVAAAILVVVGTSSLAAAGYSWWYHHRDRPLSVVEEPFPGVRYRRVVRSSPRPLIIHIASIDLSDPHVELVVTPPTPTDGRHERARTTSEFAAEFDVRLAVNANFFTPWRPGFFDYYPKRGDPVDVLGWAVSAGHAYGDGDAGFTTLTFTKEKHPHIGAPGPDTQTAVSGRPVLVRDGAVVHRTGGALEPRTAIGVNRASSTLLLVVIDGRQPNYSEGVTLAELATLMLELGAEDAINLDGGGSSTMVVRDRDSKPRVLSSPIHRRVPPGQERPIANHFGIAVRR